MQYEERLAGTLPAYAFRRTKTKTNYSLCEECLYNMKSIQSHTENSKVTYNQTLTATSMFSF